MERNVDICFGRCLSGAITWLEGRNVAEHPGLLSPGCEHTFLSEEMHSEELTESSRRRRRRRRRLRPRASARNPDEGSNSKEEEPGPTGLVTTGTVRSTEDVEEGRVHAA